MPGDLLRPSAYTIENAVVEPSSYSSCSTSCYGVPVGLLGWILVFNQALQHISMARRLIAPEVWRNKVDRAALDAINQLVRDAAVVFVNCSFWPGGLNDVRKCNPQAPIRKSSPFGEHGSDDDRSIGIDHVDARTDVDGAEGLGDVAAFELAFDEPAEFLLSGLGMALDGCCMYVGWLIGLS